MIVTTASKSFVVIVVVMTTILVTLPSAETQLKKKQHYVWKPQGRFGKRMADVRSPSIDLAHLLKQARNIKDPQADDVTLNTATARTIDDVIACLFSPNHGQYRCLRDDTENRKEDIPQNRRF